MEIPDKEISKLNYQEQCNILNSYQVLVVRHFQHRVEMIFKIIVLGGSSGNTNYYAIRVEFQVRGSPHIHSFICILNAQSLSREIKE